jgi:broad specificity phosphatase PhoE
VKLWFETHSTSIDNERGVASGHLDVPLSELGRRQAAELRVRYFGHMPRIIYTSDLARAVSTAEIAFESSKFLRAADRRLRECDYGNWSGCSVQQLQVAKVDFIDKPFPGGESFRDVVRRVENFLGDIRHLEGPVLVIAHRAPWYALEHLLRGRELSQVIVSAWKWQPGWEYDL